MYIFIPRNASEINLIPEATLTWMEFGVNWINFLHIVKAVIENCHVLDILLRPLLPYIIHLLV